MNIAIAVIGIIIGIGGIVLAYYNKSSVYGIVGAVVTLICLLIAASIQIVPTGYTGVKTTFGQISEEVIHEGINFKRPLIDSIKLVNNKQQDSPYENQIWGETIEKTPVYAAKVQVTYRIAPEKSAWLYANVSKVGDIITSDIVASSIKTAMVECTVKEVTNRSLIEPKVAEKMQIAFNQKYGEGTIDIIKVTIDDMDFEPEYNKAIAEKSIAQQVKEKQQIENDTAIAKAEADKKVKIANAEGEAQSKIIEAKAQAEANELLSNSLTDKILKDKYYDKWDGVLPKVVSDGNMLYQLGE